MQHFYELSFNDYSHKIICTGSREMTTKEIKGLFPSAFCVRICPDWIVYAYRHEYTTI